MAPSRSKLSSQHVAQEARRKVRTVRVRNISDLAGEREVREFFSFSFSGEIEHVDIRFDGVATGRTAYVTFKDPKALEIALLLSGATIVDQVVNITAAEDYIYIPVTEQRRSRRCCARKARRRPSKPSPVVLTTKTKFEKESMNNNGLKLVLTINTVKATHDKFCKDQASPVQNFKDLFSKFEYEKEKLLVQDELLGTNVEEFLKKMVQNEYTKFHATHELHTNRISKDDNSFSILRKSIGSFLVRDDGFGPNDEWCCF